MAIISLDLNPLKHLCGDVKIVVSVKNIRNMNDLFGDVRMACQDISVKCCRNLVISMRNRCEAELKQKVYATKY